MNPDHSVRAVLIMGVSCCGKSTVGRLLAAELGWDFFDGDDYHPPENKQKMSAGIPLDDHDRHPWLQTLAGFVDRATRSGPNAIVACSALKQSYRDLLIGVHRPHVVIVHLTGSIAAIQMRQSNQDRHDHFMNPALLHSQFAALEIPEGAITVDIAQPPPQIVRTILDALKRYSIAP